MNDTPKWLPNDESASIRRWTEHLHTEARKLFSKDGTHVSLVFSFNRESGLISIDPVPPNIEQDELNAAILHSVNEHNLYGVVFIGETWMYSIKEKDHTAVQLLNGEMKVSDLNEEDRKEALMIRMENRDGDSLVCLDEIIRDKNGCTLRESEMIESVKKWFVEQNHIWTG